MAFSLSWYGVHSRLANVIKMSRISSCKHLCLSSNHLQMFTQHVKISKVAFHNCKKVSTWCLFNQPCRFYNNSIKEKATSSTPEQNVVYIGPLKSLIKAVKSFSLITSAVGIVLQPLLLTNAWSSSVWVFVATGFLSSLYIFGTPLFFHLITKRYVTHLTFDPETKQFTADTFSIFLQVKHHTFTAVDVHVPDVPGIFTTFIAKNKPLFIDPRIVKEPDAFQHMMGYDKPIDLHLESDSKTPSPVKSS